MSWNRSSKEWRGIRQICRKKILNDVFKPLISEKEWFSLVLGPTGMNLLSVCFTTEEILSLNIALIERLDSPREPLKYLSAIFMLVPTNENFELLLQDFSDLPYKSLHLIFLSAVPDKMFDALAAAVNPLKLLSFLELDILFLPYESQVYSLHDKTFFTQFFNSFIDVNFTDFESTAKKLVTLFVTLGEVPLIRYRRNFIKNLIFAETIQHELDLIKESFPQSKTRDHNRCQLLILDRGFDCISPLLHEFTFQAMAYDLLNVEDDIYEYIITQGSAADERLSVPLTEDDSLWCQLRHEHIANVAKVIQDKIETDTLMEKTSFIRKKGLPNISDTIKRFILSKRNQTFYSYRHMANECMKLYCGGINIISQLEQNLALETTEDGRPTRNPLGNVLNILQDESYEMHQKMIIFLLYIFFVKGITKQGFDDILRQANLPSSSAEVIANILHLDIDLFRPEKCIPVQSSCVEPHEDSSPIFKQSRWKPLLKDILCNYVKGTLSEDHFPFLNRIDGHELIPPQRTGYWCVDKKDASISRLVVFIAGGVTYSEICCTYEVMKEYSGWDIFIGSDIRLTPKKFVEKLEELPSFLDKNES